MKNNILIGALLFLCVAQSLAQTPNTGRPKISDAGLGKNNTNFAREFFLQDNNGQPFKSYYDQVEGTPFLYEGWRQTAVVLGNGTVGKPFSLKFDLHDQELHCLSPKNEELVLNSGIIVEFVFIDSITGKELSSKFRLGYPAIDKQNQGNFYEVLADGPTQLLRFYIKDIKESKNELSGEISKEFVRYEYNYIYKNKQMKQVKKEKSFFTDLMSDKATQIEEYLKQNKVNFKNMEQVAKLVTYYNSLQTQ